MQELVRVFGYRMGYYRRKLYGLFGFCQCGSRLNYTTKGRGICPSCGR